VIARAQDFEMLLRHRPAVLNRMQQLDIGAPLAREKLGVEPVIAFAAAARAIHGPRIGDDDLMSLRREQATDPRRVRPDLEHHTTRRPIGEEAGARRTLASTTYS
jgi:hypothetical protein